MEGVKHGIWAEQKHISCMNKPRENVYKCMAWRWNAKYKKKQKKKYKSFFPVLWFNLNIQLVNNWAHMCECNNWVRRYGMYEIDVYFHTERTHATVSIHSARTHTDARARTVCNSFTWKLWILLLHTNARSIYLLQYYEVNYPFGIVAAFVGGGAAVVVVVRRRRGRRLPFRLYFCFHRNIVL